MPLFFLLQRGGEGFFENLTQIIFVIAFVLIPVLRRLLGKAPGKGKGAPARGASTPVPRPGARTRVGPTESKGMSRVEARDLIERLKRGENAPLSEQRQAPVREPVQSALEPMRAELPRLPSVFDEDVLESSPELLTPIDIDSEEGRRRRIQPLPEPAAGAGARRGKRHEEPLLRGLRGSQARGAWRRAVVLAEVLGPPLALQRGDSQSGPRWRT